MRLVLTSLVLVIVSGNVLAEDDLLDRLGLGGLVAVTVAESEEVIGLGFASSIGIASVVGGFSTMNGGAPIHDCDDGGSGPPIDPESIDLDASLDASLSASLSACQDLNLEGLARLEGFVGALGFLEMSFSENVGGEYSLLSGSVSISSNSSSIGAVH